MGDFARAKNTNDIEPVRGENGVLRLPGYEKAGPSVRVMKRQVSSRYGGSGIIFIRCLVTKHEAGSYPAVVGPRSKSRSQVAPCRLRSS